jgi:hypothetical protein
MEKSFHHDGNPFSITLCSVFTTVVFFDLTAKRLPHREEREEREEKSKCKACF